MMTLCHHLVGLRQWDALYYCCVIVVCHPRPFFLKQCIHTYCFSHILTICYSVEIVEEIIAEYRDAVQSGFGVIACIALTTQIIYCKFHFTSDVVYL